MIVTKYLIKHRLKPDNNLIINTLSGAVDVIDDKTCSFINEGKVPKDDGIVGMLKERGYLYKNNEEEKQRFFNLKKNYKLRTDKFLPKEQGIIICPTYSCNLRCPYCFQSHGSMHENKKTMTKEQVDQAIEKIEENIIPNLGRKGYRVTLFGGEPLQKHTYEIVEYILKKLSKKNIRVNIITNGVNIGMFWDVFKLYKKIISFQITLDGPSDIHDKRRVLYNRKGTFDIIKSNIDRLIKDGFNVKVRVNTDLEVIDKLQELLDQFVEKSWVNYSNFRAQLSPVSSHGEDNPTCACLPEFEILTALIDKFEDIEYLKERYKTILGSDMYRVVGHLYKIINTKIGKGRFNPYICFCEAGRVSSVGVGPDGFIYVCGETIGKEKYAVGKYWPELELYEDKLNDWKDRTIFEIDECVNCNISTLCGGGCLYGALKHNGRPNAPYCGRTREIINKFLNDNTEKFLSLVSTNKQTNN
ncbi:radical SAM protein [Herbivorax sp. ANBcel31]|uniref:radical SAM/SPASM domain-containing protein n=1 Tax=Herbivorax sp. ANBcel31 TaxID=3069754 RepID=UPI0027AE5FED|nr:radical SAM protein [Herbivorax sp. ANBcel31]MDQ2086409.1 radical SAM protein [Herbivorax sp. ANBcel31]